MTAVTPMFSWLSHIKFWTNHKLTEELPWVLFFVQFLLTELLMLLHLEPLQDKLFGGDVTPAISSWEEPCWKQVCTRHISFTSTSAQKFITLGLLRKCVALYCGKMGTIQVPPGQRVTVGEEAQVADARGMQTACPSVDALCAWSRRCSPSCREQSALTPPDSWCPGPCSGGL